MCPMSPRPIAYVMEQTLGNITHYRNLRLAEPATTSELRRWLPIEYRESRVPWTIHGSYLARRALASVIDEVDGAFIHTMTLAPASIDLFLKKPVVISSDGPAMAKSGMREAYGDPMDGALARLAKREVHRQVLKRAAGCVAWSNWAKESFVRDYGRRERDVAVIPPGVDLQLYAPGDRDHELPRILFVGGAFLRKGGDLLLQVFRKHLRGRAELVLVTRDAVPTEPGVSVHRNLGNNSRELLHLYATCDVFVLPTRADCWSLVLTEALAAGMPVITTRVGGLAELVTEGKTGHLIDVDDEQALETALLSLALDRDKCRAMACSAREDAFARFQASANAQALFDFVRSRC
jgi:glycosyltransferase involved in cell wall biosynthesis